MDKLIVASDLIIYYPDLSSNKVQQSLQQTSTLSVKVGSNLDSTHRINRLKGLVRGQYNIKTDDVREIKIKNTGLRLQILEQTKLSYDCYSTTIGLALKSPELDNIGFVPIIYLNIKDFVEILGKSRLITNGILPFEFCFYNKDNTSVNSLTLSPRIEDDFDEELKLAKEAGSGIKKKKTSNWIPGHLYILNNKKYIIALGDFENFLYNLSSWWKSDEKTINPLTDDVFENKYKYHFNNVYTKNVRAFLEIKDLKGELDSLKGRSIFNFLVEDVIESPSDLCRERFFVRSLEGSKLTGTDLGEILTPDKDYINKIRMFCRENLEVRFDSKYLRFYSEYFDTRKDELYEKLKKEISDHFKSKLNSYYGKQITTKADFIKSSLFTDCKYDLDRPDSFYSKIFTKDELESVLLSSIPFE